MMGLSVEALRDANQLIDGPERWLNTHGFYEINLIMKLFGSSLKHDDDRKLGMKWVRFILQSIHGQQGILAADLHYAIDYIERWLDPEMAKWIIEKISMNDLLPPNRHGFVHKYRREWSPAYRDNFLPITAYCSTCKGRMKPINAPFCNECRIDLLENAKGSVKITLELIINMLAKKIVEREICQEVVDFIRRNLQAIIEMIIEDRRQRGLNSIIAF